MDEWVAAAKGVQMEDNNKSLKYYSKIRRDSKGLEGGTYPKGGQSICLRRG